MSKKGKWPFSLTTLEISAHWAGVGSTPVCVCVCVFECVFYVKGGREREGMNRTCGCRGANAKQQRNEKPWREAPLAMRRRRRRRRRRTRRVVRARVQQHDAAAGRRPQIVQQPREVEALGLGIVVAVRSLRDARVAPDRVVVDPRRRGDEHLGVGQVAALELGHEAAAAGAGERLLFFSCVGVPSCVLVRFVFGLACFVT